MTNQFNHHYAALDSIKLHYVRHGNGRPVLLIHGWPGFWFEWHKNIEKLAGHFDVVAPDMRGFAYSDKPSGAPEVDYTDTKFAEDIRALCDHLGFDKVSIVSHDFGAIWVQKFARLHPDRLDKLVLFDPPYPGIGARWFELPHVLHTWYQLFHQQPWAEELVGSSRAATRIYVKHFLSAWSADKELWTEDEVDQYVDAYSQPGALRGGFNCYRAALRGGAFSAGGEPTIKHPSLILWGDSDPILPFAWSDNLLQTFPNHTLKKIEAAGHFMMREAPDRVNPEIIGFLE